MHYLTFDLVVPFRLIVFDFFYIIAFYMPFVFTFTCCIIRCSLFSSSSSSWIANVFNHWFWRDWCFEATGNHKHFSLSVATNWWRITSVLCCCFDLELTNLMRSILIKWCITVRLFFRFYWNYILTISLSFSCFLLFISNFELNCHPIVWRSDNV